MFDQSGQEENNFFLSNVILLRRVDFRKQLLLHMMDEYVNNKIIISMFSNSHLRNSTSVCRPLLHRTMRIFRSLRLLTDEILPGRQCVRLAWVVQLACLLKQIEQRVTFRDVATVNLHFLLFSPNSRPDEINHKREKTKWVKDILIHFSSCIFWRVIKYKIFFFFFYAFWLV